MCEMTGVLLFCAMTLTLAWLFAAQRRRVARTARRFVALPRVEQALLVVAVGVMTVCAQKQRTENSEQLTDVVAEASDSNFNAEILEKGRRGEEVATQTKTDSASPSLDNLRVKAPQASASANPCESVKSVAITTDDIVRGYALVEVRTNAAVSYGMPTNGVEVGTWGKTGTYQDVVRVSLDFSHGDTCTVETRSVSEGRFGEAEPEGRASVCETRSGEIIELSNNRIIELAEASAFGSDDSRRAAANAEVETVAPQAEEESLSNRNSIIRQFDYSIIDSQVSATSDTSVLRAKTTLTTNDIARSYALVETVAPQAEEESLSNRNSIIRQFD